MHTCREFRYNAAARLPALILGVVGVVHCTDPLPQPAADTAAHADADAAGKVAPAVYTCQDPKDSGCAGKLGVFLAASATPIGADTTVFVPQSAWLPDGQFLVEFRLRNLAAPPGGVVAPSAITLAPVAAGKAVDLWSCQDSGGVPCHKVTWKTLMPAGWPANSPDTAAELSFRLGGAQDATSAGMRVCVVATGDPGLGKQGLCFTVRPAAPPNLVLEPAKLVFDGTQWHQEQSRGLQVRNDGHATLRIAKVEAHLPPEFSVGIGTATLAGGATLTDLNLPVAGGKSQLWKVTRQPGPLASGTFRLHLWTDDPQWPGGRVVPVVMESQPTCLAFAAKSLSLSALQGQKASHTAILRNECGLPLAVTEVAVQAGSPVPTPFAVDWAASAQKTPGVPLAPPSLAQSWTLAPGESVPLVIAFTGTAQAQAKATLVARAGSDVAAFPLAGDSAVPSGCPKAVLKVAEADVVVPQTVLHFDATGSVASGAATVAKYLWTVQQPAGSVQLFSPGPDVAQPTFAANVVGPYEFCLRVWDTAGVPSCVPSCKTVLVVPDVALHIELVWQTPSDPDESDDGPAAGSDLDLHFAHPKAATLDLDCDGTLDPWFSNPWDTFWFNAAPAWGDPNNKDDDPTLDLDDTSGAGPENLNLVAPEGTVANPVTYPVGVHYWNAHGYGLSYATVSVFAQGALATKLAKVKLKEVDFWTVGRVHWPIGGGAAGQKFFEVCRQTGDSCKAGKNLMWQAAGDFCIAPCYANKTFNGSFGGAGSCK